MQTVSLVLAALNTGLMLLLLCQRSRRQVLR